MIICKLLLLFKMSLGAIYCEEIAMEVFKFEAKKVIFLV
jgi:hypothetical protein